VTEPPAAIAEISIHTAVGAGSVTVTPVAIAVHIAAGTRMLTEPSAAITAAVLITAGMRVLTVTPSAIGTAVHIAAGIRVFTVTSTTIAAVSCALNAIRNT
jgi:hypothetical protein